MSSDNSPLVRNKYSREIKPGVWVDVYDVLRAFDTGCPAVDHAVKKLLAPGQRGVKPALQDKQEAIQSVQRSIEEDMLWERSKVPSVDPNPVALRAWVCDPSSVLYGTIRRLIGAGMLEGPTSDACLTEKGKAVLREETHVLDEGSLPSLS